MKQMQKPHSLKFLRQRRFLTVLPLLIVPFITLAFWAMGGGDSSANKNEILKQAGINFLLPDPKVQDDQKENKLSFYDQAEADSIKKMQEKQLDPFYQNGLDTADMFGNGTLTSRAFGISNEDNPSPYFLPDTSNRSEAKIYERLNAINKVIQDPVEKKLHEHGANSASNITAPGKFSDDVDKLENLLQAMDQKEGDDPEMQQLGNMLDKIIAVQHPEKVAQTLSEKSINDKKQVFTVRKKEVSTWSTCLISNIQKQKDTAVQEKRNAFFSSEPTAPNTDINTIPAAVYQTQTLTTGSTVKLRLLSDVYVNGKAIAAGSFVFGTATLQHERLLIKISAIRYGSNLLPVSLAAYDLDGLEGISTPGSNAKEVAVQSADQSLQNIQLMSLDPSLKAQAATVGLQTAKGLLSKKVKQTKVTVQGGYSILLKDLNNPSN